ncbi:MAG: hypothetical protein IPK50_03755 [Fibrobacterota bacterium]|nr:hypothetical protein [Fibrobacterota bacterium]QQS06010.1 MAG: hypothetical protein IPK50_03755 [Fibrobacterota bacterium]
MVHSLVLFLVSTAFSSSDLISASGTVTDLSNHPLGGVVVQLESDTTLKATSALDGTWTMENPFSAIRFARPPGKVRIEGHEMVIETPKPGVLRLDVMGFDGSLLSTISKSVPAGESRMELPSGGTADHLLRLRLDGTILFSGKANPRLGSSALSSAKRTQASFVDRLVYTHKGLVRAKGGLKSWRESGIVQQLDTSSANCVGDILFGNRSVASTSYEADNGGSWSKIEIELSITKTPTRTCESIVSPMTIIVFTTTITPTPGLKSAGMRLDTTHYMQDSVRSVGLIRAPGLASPIQFRHLSGPKGTITYKSMEIDVSPEGYLGKNGIYLTLEASKMSWLVLNNVQVNLDTLRDLVSKATPTPPSASR